MVESTPLKIKVLQYEDSDGRLSTGSEEIIVIDEAESIA
jgi:hypothetical protein